jgi:hypothetical protein
VKGSEGMRIEIEIPKEFEEHFKQDRFEESLQRLRTNSLAGRYEEETLEMLIEAFKNAKPAYDVDKVVNELESKRKYYQQEMDKAERDTDVFSGDIFDENYNREYAIKEAIAIVKQGGVTE